MYRKRGGPSLTDPRRNHDCSGSQRLVFQEIFRERVQYLTLWLRPFSLVSVSGHRLVNETFKTYGSSH